MKKKSPNFLLLIAILAYGLVMGGYFIHIGLLKLKFINTKQISEILLFRRTKDQHKKNR